MSALISKIGQWFATYVVKYLIRYIADHLTAWIERRRASEEQTKKDEATKPTYDSAVKNGSEEEIVKATEDRLNG